MTIVTGDVFEIDAASLKDPVKRAQAVLIFGEPLVAEVERWETPGDGIEVVYTIDPDDTPPTSLQPPVA